MFQNFDLSLRTFANCLRLGTKTGANLEFLGPFVLKVKGKGVNLYSASS